MTLMVEMNSGFINQGFCNKETTETYFRISFRLTLSLSLSLSLALSLSVYHCTLFSLKLAAINIAV